MPKERLGIIVKSDGSLITTAQGDKMSLSSRELLITFINTAEKLDEIAWNTITKKGICKWNHKDYALYDGLVYLKSRASIQLGLNITKKALNKHKETDSISAPWVEDLLEDEDIV